MGLAELVEKTFDISADLIELGKTPVAVVSAGAKVFYLILLRNKNKKSLFWIFQKH